MARAAIFSVPSPSLLFLILARSSIFDSYRFPVDLRTHQILLICALLACVRPISAQGWYQEFTPTRTFYISPSGSTSPTGSETDPYSLSQVIAQGFAQPGDLYYALPGTYNAGTDDLLAKNSISRSLIINIIRRQCLLYCALPGQ